MMLVRFLLPLLDRIRCLVQSFFIRMTIKYDTPKGKYRDELNALAYRGMVMEDTMRELSSAVFKKATIVSPEA
jgi:hypothetical protein